MLPTMVNRGYNPLVAIQMALSGQIYAETGDWLRLHFIPHWPKHARFSVPD